VGDYEFALKAGPDPAMLVSFISLPSASNEAFEHAKMDASEIFGEERRIVLSGGDAIQPSVELIQLMLDGDVTFVIRINKSGFYAMFIEHHPSEFEATLRRDGKIISATLQQDFPSAHAHERDDHDHDHKHDHQHKHDHMHGHKHGHTHHH
jgi:hypothetical protein